MPESVVIEVPVKSPVQGTKSPAQVRLESRANEPRSPLSPAALKQNLENAELNRKNLLMARAEKCRDNYSKAKEVSITQKEAFNEKTNLQAESIQNRLAVAEANRLAQTEKCLEQTKAMNQRVQEAQKKREEQIASEKEELDKSVSSSKERLSAAEERRTSMLREAQEKAAAEVAKVCVRENKMLP
mmetsp:Transcript_30087/g.96777  ORF Transcript_30087/g.96777 Transcript_30087/m.96777 type:complete len:186 (-) Transcript_30087:854-1411(-)